MAALRAALDALKPARKIYEDTLRVKAAGYWNRHLTPQQRQQLSRELKGKGYSFKGSALPAFIRYVSDELRKSGHISRQTSAPDRTLRQPLNSLPLVPAVETSAVIKQLSTDTWSDQGPLRAMGYKAGRSGLAAPERRAILYRAYSSPEIEGWGAPHSLERLIAIKNALQRFIHLRKKSRKADYSQAILDWQSDVRWLNQMYRDKRSQSTW